MSGAPKLPRDVLELICQAKKELPGEFVAYPLDSSITIEEFRQSLLEKIKNKKTEQENIFF